MPDELHATPDSLITVSTVHRAKGLEFDRVLVVRSGWKTPFDDDGAHSLWRCRGRSRTLCSSIFQTSAATEEALVGSLALDRVEGVYYA